MSSIPTLEFNSKDINNKWLSKIESFFKSCKSDVAYVKFDMNTFFDPNYLSSDEIRYLKFLSLLPKKEFNGYQCGMIDFEKYVYGYLKPRGNRKYNMTKEMFVDSNICVPYNTLSFENVNDSNDYFYHTLTCDFNAPNWLKVNLEHLCDNGMIMYIPTRFEFTKNDNAKDEHIEGIEVSDSDEDIDKLEDEKEIMDSLKVYGVDGEINDKSAMRLKTKMRMTDPKLNYNPVSINIPLSRDIKENNRMILHNDGEGIIGGTLTNSNVDTKLLPFDIVGTSSDVKCETPISHYKNHADKQTYLTLDFSNVDLRTLLNEYAELERKRRESNDMEIINKLRDKRYKIRAMMKFKK